jgi:hypothetical protein
VKVFSLAMVTPELNLGIQTLVQGFGLGHLRANIILANWLEHAPTTAGEQRELIYGENLRSAFRLGCNLVVLDTDDAEWAALQQTTAQNRRIDVWWRDDASSRLMLLLAHLMTRTDNWEGTRIRLLGICCSTDATKTAESLNNILDEVRISAEAILVEQTGAAAVAQHSADASLVFVPFRLRGNQPLGPFDGPIEDLLAPLPVTALVLAAEDIDLDAEPEEGAAADTARILDLLTDTERLAKLTAHDAEKAEKAAQKLREELHTETAKPGDPDVIAKLTTHLRELERQAEKSRRRAARVAAKAQSARENAEAKGLLAQPEPEDDGAEQ